MIKYLSIKFKKILTEVAMFAIPFIILSYFGKKWFSISMQDGTNHTFIGFFTFIGSLVALGLAYIGVPVMFVKAKAEMLTGWCEQLLDLWEGLLKQIQRLWNWTQDR